MRTRLLTHAAGLGLIARKAPLSAAAAWHLHRAIHTHPTAAENEVDQRRRRSSSSDTPVTHRDPLASATVGTAAVPRGRLFIVRPDLIDDWIPELNAADVCRVHCSSRQVAWWRCGRCRLHYPAAVRLRVAYGAQCCPHCHGTGVLAPSSATPSSAEEGGTNTRRMCKEEETQQRTDAPAAGAHNSSQTNAACARPAAHSESVTRTNAPHHRHRRSLAVTHPALAARWDDTRNGLLRPRDVDSSSALHVWWLGSESAADDRTRASRFVRPVRVCVRDDTSPQQQQRAQAEVEWSLLARIRRAMNVWDEYNKNGNTNNNNSDDDISVNSNKVSGNSKSTIPNVDTSSLSHITRWNDVYSAVELDALAWRHHQSPSAAHTSDDATAEALAVELWCEAHTHTRREEEKEEETSVAASRTTTTQGLIGTELQRGGPAHNVDQAVRHALLRMYAAQTALLHRAAAQAQEAAMCNESTGAGHVDVAAGEVHTMHAAHAATSQTTSSTPPPQPQPQQPVRRAVLHAPTDWVSYFSLTRAQEAMLRSFAHGYGDSIGATMESVVMHMPHAEASGAGRDASHERPVLNEASVRASMTPSRHTSDIAAVSTATMFAAPAHRPDFPDLPTLAERWRDNASLSSTPHDRNSSRNVYPPHHANSSTVSRAMSAHESDSAHDSASAPGVGDVAAADDDDAVVRSYPRFMPYSSAYLFDDDMVNATPVETIFATMQRNRADANQGERRAHTATHALRRRTRRFMLDPRRPEDYLDAEEAVFGAGDVVRGAYDTDGYRHAMPVSSDVEGALELAAELRATTTAANAADTVPHKATSLVNISIAALGQNHIAAADVRALHQQKDILGDLQPPSVVPHGGQATGVHRMPPLRVDTYYETHVDGGEPVRRGGADGCRSGSACGCACRCRGRRGWLGLRLRHRRKRWRHRAHRARWLGHDAPVVGLRRSEEYTHTHTRLVGSV